jgi:hypothetical protein
MSGGSDGDRVRATLRELIRRSGLNNAKVSRAIRKNRAYLHQYLQQGKPARLPAPVRFALARLFDVDPELLRDGDDPPARPPRETLNPRLVHRTVVVVGTLLSGFDASQDVQAQVFAAVYALLERERAGYPITDDEATLTIIKSLIERLRLI